MSILTSVKLATKQAASSGEEYIDATQDYVELKVFQQITLSFSIFAKILIIGGLCFTGLLFLLVAGILLLGEYLDDYKLALLYFSLISFALSALVYVFRKHLIESRIIKKVSKSFFL